MQSATKAIAIALFIGSSAVPAMADCTPQVPGAAICVEGTLTVQNTWTADNCTKFGVVDSVSGQETGFSIGSSTPNQAGKLFQLSALIGHTVHVEGSANSNNTCVNGTVFWNPAYMQAK